MRKYILHAFLCLLIGYFTSSNSKSSEGRNYEELWNNINYLKTIPYNLKIKSIDITKSFKQECRFHKEVTQNLNCIISCLNSTILSNYKNVIQAQYLIISDLNSTTLSNQKEITRSVTLIISRLNRTIFSNQTAINTWHQGAISTIAKLLNTISPQTHIPLQLSGVELPETTSNPIPTAIDLEWLEKLTGKTSEYAKAIDSVRTFIPTLRLAKTQLDQFFGLPTISLSVPAEIPLVTLIPQSIRSLLLSNQMVNVLLNNTTISISQMISICQINSDIPLRRILRTVLLTPNHLFLS